MSDGLPGYENVYSLVGKRVQDSSGSIIRVGLMKTEAACSSEMSAPTYQTTTRYNPQNLHTDKISIQSLKLVQLLAQEIKAKL
jgi:hypothetical protein